ncbi:MAG: pyruvate dehydrogenase complex dihydrolipoamide acetyltransferase [Bacteroidetes bacterium]|nr:pyruvate dehydrogenase complex dihydrolipoamide acetyltransferase [Bacteroidota bacterium]
MAIAVEMPKMSDTMEEGVLVAWNVEEGADVAPGDVIAQVETDKATMDLEAYDDGVLLKKVAAEGSSVPIGGLIAVLGQAGEDVSEIVSNYSNKSSVPAGGDGASAEENEADRSAEDTQTEVSASSADGRIKASPLARKLASTHGLALDRIRGTGPEGRIVKRDIEAAMGGAASAAVVPDTRPAADQSEPSRQAPKSAPAKQPAPVPAIGFRNGEGDQPAETVQISQMRKTIARRLSQSKFTAPHFYLTVDVDMAAAIAARDQINAAADAAGRNKISFNDLVTKACAQALRLHPSVNSSWMEERGVIERHQQVHVSVAVAVDEGLVTPVIRNADRKGLEQIAWETRELATRARNRQLQPEEFQGSTFTTSNLGMFGIEEFTAIINPPNACILAIGTIRDEAVVQDGEVVAGKRMKLTLSCDHRVVDGATGARFLGTVQQHLEQPATMLL